MASSAMQAISKITVRDCGANAASVLAMDGADARAPLIRVWGYARGVKDVKSANRMTGEVTVHKAIMGDFRAVNLTSGERFSSGLMYLPSGIHELILSPLEQAKAANEDAEMEFGFDIYGRKSSSPAGYGYVAVILGQDPTVVDTMGELEKKLSEIAGVPALPPPPAKDQLKLEKK